MAGFLYYAPWGVDPSLERVREWGLGYAFDRTPSARQVDGGPDGGRGFAFADSKRLGRPVKYEPDAQRWRRIPGDHPVWLGYYVDEPPTPTDLKRAEIVEGYKLKLGDHEWILPLVRAFDLEAGESISALPCVYDLDAEGNLIRGEVKSSYRYLWDLTEWAWQAMISEAEVTDQALLDTAAKLLAVNYAVSPIELVTMGALSPEMGPANLVALSIDYLTWRKWRDTQKKRERSGSIGDGSNMSHGVKAAAEAISQPAPIS